jgi:hypothetical protein
MPGVFGWDFATTAVCAAKVLGCVAGRALNQSRHAPYVRRGGWSAVRGVAHGRSSSALELQRTHYLLACYQCVGSPQVRVLLCIHPSSSDRLVEFVTERRRRANQILNQERTLLQIDNEDEKYEIRARKKETYSATDTSQWQLLVLP